MRAVLLTVVAGFAVPGAADGAPPKTALPQDGEVFEVSGRTEFLIPAQADPHAAVSPRVSGNQPGRRVRGS